jgi:uncharacterized phage-like protein YoqJ
MIVAFTGHRPNNKSMGGYNLPNPTYNFVCQQIEKHLKELKPEKIISGMALGVNQWAANIAVKLRIPFIAAVPFANQESKWPEKSRIIYQKLLTKAHDIVFVSPPGYKKHKMQVRNEWMVDHCDLLIGVFDGTSGGTANCIAYAKSCNKNIIIIDPNLKNT